MCAWNGGKKINESVLYFLFLSPPCPSFVGMHCLDSCLIPAEDLNKFPLDCPESVFLDEG